MMGAARAGVLALLCAWLRLATAVRMQNENVEESSLVVDPTQDPGLDQSNCTTELVQDGLRCGIDEVIKMIVDGLLCGFEWCEVPPIFMCPKSCEQVVRENRTCQVLVSCPIRVTMHVNGSVSTASIANMSIEEAELLNFTVEQKSREVQETLDGNLDRVLPILNEVIDIGVPIANYLLKTELANFEQQLMQVLQSQIAAVDDWRTKTLLGGSGFSEGFMAAITARFSHIGADMSRRFEAKAPVVENDSTFLCDRLLRVRPKGGEEFLVKGWSNAIVARKYDSSTDCTAVYTAHCHSGEFTQTKQCPLKETTVKRMCLFNTLCWIPSRTITGSEDKVVTIFKGQEQLVHTDDVFIDHVAVAKDAPARTLNATPVVTPVDSSDVDSSELDAVIQIKDALLPETILYEVCSRRREDAWFSSILGGLAAARCGAVLRPIMALFSLPVDIGIGSQAIAADVSLSGGQFKAELIPDWEVMSAAAEAALMAELDKESFPFDIKVQALNLKLNGDAHRMTVELRPVMTGTISESELQEMRDRIFTTVSP